VRRAASTTPRAGTFARAGQFVLNCSGSDGGALTTQATGVGRWGVVTCGRRPIREIPMKSDAKENDGKQNDGKEKARRGFLRAGSTIVAMVPLCP
jgi:hypothetical protein